MPEELLQGRQRDPLLDRGDGEGVAQHMGVTDRLRWARLTMSLTRRAIVLPLLERRKVGSWTSSQALSKLSLKSIQNVLRLRSFSIIFSK